MTEHGQTRPRHKATPEKQAVADGACMTSETMPGRPELVRGAGAEHTGGSPDTKGMRIKRPQSRPVVRPSRKECRKSTAARRSGAIIKAAGPGPAGGENARDSGAGPAGYLYHFPA